MFGPNTIIDENVHNTSSHRDTVSVNLVKTTTQKLKRVFNWQNYDLLYIPASGSFAVEAVLWSIGHSVSIKGIKGRFYDRWEATIKHTNKHIGSNKDYKYSMGCQLETSRSYLNQTYVDIVDAISAFPFYNLPNAPVFVITVNKLLGCLPGLSIVGVRKDWWHNIKTTNEQSVLSLRSYKDNMPMTYPIHIFKQLLDKLSDPTYLLDIKNNVMRVCSFLCDVIGKNKFMNEIRCPVLTFKRDGITQEFAKKWELYNSGGFYQIFTYTEHWDKYLKFAKEYHATFNK